MTTAAQVEAKPRSHRTLKIAAAVLLGLPILALVICAASNLGLPRHSATLDRLDAAETAKIAEALHLKTSLGESIWPGWGHAQIPVLVYNEQFGFLIGDLASPPPQGGKLDNCVLETPCYRVRAPKSAFAVKIGDHWVGSIGTQEWMQISFVDQTRRRLLPVLRSVVPYRAVLRVFGLTSTDWHIAVVLHENFHAYQAETDPVRFVNAQRAYRDESRYPWNDSATRNGWVSEFGALRAGINATTTDDAIAAARLFLSTRQQRRQQLRLDAALVSYERHLEWLEGLAKYVELASWKTAALDRNYHALPELRTDTQFNNYKGFAAKWSGEMGAMRTQAYQEGDMRFYYSGMAQAFLLDRLMPVWKQRVMQKDVWLEDLLAEAVKQR